MAATRVSEAKPPSDKRAAARSLISASTNRASASAKRALASGKRASASNSRARASSSAMRRVPGSSEHINCPSSTISPRRNGVLITRPIVSARTSTCRIASVRPRKITAPSTLRAALFSATTETLASPFSSAGSSSTSISAGVLASASLPPANSCRLSRWKTNR